MSAPVVTDQHRSPEPPWVAAALEPSATHYRDAMAWLGDFERCLGWAWLAGFFRDD